jgi:hypothetical protein
LESYRHERNHALHVHLICTSSSTRGITMQKESYSCLVENRGGIDYLPTYVR